VPASVRHLIASWLIYWLVIAVLPVHSIFPATLPAFLLQATFLVLAASSAWLVTWSFGLSRMPVAILHDISNGRLLVWCAIAMGTAGFLLLLYDKVVVQGIDYSSGIAIAREQWRLAGEERGGQASSPFSVAGYLLGSSYFIAAALAASRSASLAPWESRAVLAISLLLLLANSLLTGGRSSILLMAPFLLAAYSARSQRSRAPWNAQFALKVTAVSLAGLLFLSYTVYVFFQRASAGSGSAADYALDFLPFLGLEADSWYVRMIEESFFGDLSAMLVLTFSYLTHSLATVAAVIDSPSEDKVVMFMHVTSILSRLGLIEAPDTEWALSGRLTSLPGALYLQFGALGVPIGGLLTGLTLGLSIVWTASKPRRLLPFIGYCLMNTITILSPALFSADFLSFPFIVLAAILVPVVAGIVATFLRPSRSGIRQVRQLVPRRHLPPTGPD
jgi:oligosaccharide repeat unit polymerase